MTKLTRDKVQQMNLKERIALESQRAAELGFTPKRSVFLDPKLSAEGSTAAQFSAKSTLLPTTEEARVNDLDFQKVVNPDLSGVPDYIKPLAFKDSLKALQENISRNLDAMTPSNQDKLLPVIMGQFRDLQIQYNDEKLVAKLQKRISSALFGTGEFTDLRGKGGGTVSTETLLKK